MPRLNFTGRKKIARSSVQVVIRDGVPPRFDARISLGAYRLPSDAHVCVEAYRQTSWMRFPFGTVGALKEPADRRLLEFEDADGVLFRLKVISSREAAGRLVAQADRIPPRTDIDRSGQTESLLKVRSVDLGQEVWRFEMDDGACPRLLLNKALGDKNLVCGSPVFRALVIPQVLRLVLLRLFVEESSPEEADEGTAETREHWRRLVSRVPGVPSLPDDEDSERARTWVDEVIAAFCRSHRSLDQFCSAWEAGS